MNKPDELTTGAFPSEAGMTVTTDVPTGADNLQLVSPLASHPADAGVTIVAPVAEGQANTITFDVEKPEPGDKTIHS